jgi:hypothetical protein
VPRNESVEWARKQGLDLSKKKDFDVRVTLGTARTKPKDDGGKTPSFVLIITKGLWWVLVYMPDESRRGYSRFSCSREPGKKLKLQGDEQELDLPPPKTLAKMREWLVIVEEKLGVTFRRDFPLIQSNVKHGADAMRAWIAETK